MSQWAGYKNYSHFFNFSQFNTWFEEAASQLELITNKRGTVEYFNNPCSFDIETSSFEQGGEKKACMYLWAFGLNGSVIYGREWNQFNFIINFLKLNLGLGRNRILICYVHNLGYEFQFFRKRIDWVEVFSVKNRRPVKALSKLGIEFRCSLILSNYKLAYVGSELLTKYPVTKKVGDLDYSLIRFPITPITQKELGYQVNDVRVVMSYIQEKIENDGSILEIPLTNTGYVRRYCRKYCLGEFEGDESTRKKKMYAYRNLMRDLQVETEKEYQQLRKAFAGGFTHANPNYWGKIVKNVGSADLTSSYPYAMVSDYFPMSGGHYVGEVTSEELFNIYLSKYCCLFTVCFYNIYSVVSYDNYISKSKCTYISDDAVINNGRVASASELQITITELDWDIISKVYDWDEDGVEIFDMRIYVRGYLPKPLIMSILELYKNKTTLKGIDDKQVEYMVSKNMINSAYGMAVTNIVRDEIVYEEDEWSKDVADPASQLVDYNKQFNRFLFYAWGVWVTAHARHNLWEAIFEFQDDYIYADTDSIKGVNFEKHQAFFKLYNLRVRGKLAKMCAHYHIPFDLCQPMTKKGERKLIGVWDIEEGYLLFKTIGAKRYMYEYENHIFSATVAGVNKYEMIPYMLYMYNGEKYRTKEWLEKFRQAYDQNPEHREEMLKAQAELIKLREDKKISYELPMKFFENRLIIPEEHTGKMLLTYLDDTTKFSGVDYLGNKYEGYELSSIHMEKEAYNFSISSEYLRFLEGIEDASI